MGTLFHIQIFFQTQELLDEEKTTIEVKIYKVSPFRNQYPMVFLSIQQGSFDSHFSNLRQWFFVSKIVLNFCEKNFLVINGILLPILFWPIVVVIEKIFWNSRLNLFKQWKVRTIIFGINKMIF